MKCRKRSGFEHELDEADEQLATGDYIEYDETTIHELVERDKTRGLERLANERRHGAR